MLTLEILKEILEDGILVKVNEHHPEHKHKVVTKKMYSKDYEQKFYKLTNVIIQGHDIKEDNLWVDLEGYGEEFWLESDFKKGGICYYGD